MDYNPTTDNYLRTGLSLLSDLYGGRAVKLLELPKAIGPVAGHFASQAERMPEPFWGKYIDKHLEKRKEKK